MIARSSGFFSRAALACARIASSLGTVFESICVVPSAASTMLNTVWMSEPDAAFGRSSGTDCETMSFAVTMKMMRRTSMMSTSGVTLIPVIASFASSCAPPAISCRPRPSGPSRVGLASRARRARPPSRSRPRRRRRPCPVALRCARRTWLSASVFASVARTMRWNQLNAATAGMATSRPTAVATSASAMFVMTASGSDLRRRARSSSRSSPCRARRTRRRCR